MYQKHSVDHTSPGDGKDQENKIRMLGLHKANWQLKQELKAKEAFYERQIKVARGELPPTELDSNYQAIPKDERERQSQHVVKSLRKSAFDIIIARATVTFMIGDYIAMEGHASNAAQRSSPLTDTKLYEKCHYIRGVAFYHQRRFSEAFEAFSKSRNCKRVEGFSDKTAKEWIEEIQDRILDTSLQTPASAELPPRRVFGEHLAHRREITPHDLPGSSIEENKASSIMKPTIFSSPPTSPPDSSDSDDDNTDELMRERKAQIDAMGLSPVHPSFEVVDPLLLNPTNTMGNQAASFNAIQSSSPSESIASNSDRGRHLSPIHNAICASRAASHDSVGLGGSFISRRSRRPLSINSPGKPASIQRVRAVQPGPRSLHGDLNPKINRSWSASLRSSKASKLTKEDALKFASDRSASLRLRGAIPAWSPESSPGIEKRRQAKRASASPESMLSKAAPSYVTHESMFSKTSPEPKLQPLRRTSSSSQPKSLLGIRAQRHENTRDYKLFQQRNPNPFPPPDPNASWNKSRQARRRLTTGSTSISMRRIAAANASASASHRLRSSTPATAIAIAQPPQHPASPSTSPSLDQDEINAFFGGARGGAGQMTPSGSASTSAQPSRQNPLSASASATLDQDEINALFGGERGGAGQMTPLSGTPTSRSGNGKISDDDEDDGDDDDGWEEDDSEEVEESVEDGGRERGGYAVRMLRGGEREIIRRRADDGSD